jgi:polyferredoxin
MKRHLKLPRGVEHGLRWVGPLLIGMVLFVTMVHVPFNLAGIEPFDAYLIRNAGAATIAVAAAGLVAAAFVPMAYCRFGCPTGAVLSFVRSHGKADGFSRRDLAAGLLVLGVIALYIWYQPLHHRLIG